MTVMQSNESKKLVSASIPRKHDPVAKSNQLKSSISKVLKVPESDLFLPSSPHPDPSHLCLCLLNIGNQGFLSIRQEQFDALVEELIPNPQNLHARWFPLGKTFSFLQFTTSLAAAQAFQRFHGKPCAHLPGNTPKNPRLGLAAFVNPQCIPGKPRGFDLQECPPQVYDEDDEVALDIVPGLHLVKEFISEDEERKILAEIESIPEEQWNFVHGRRVIHFGYEFVYSKFSLVPGQPFPEFLSQLKDRIAPYLGGYAPTQATISIYPVRCGIPHHVDVKEFGPYLASLSLRSGASMHFRKASNGLARAPQFVGEASDVTSESLDGTPAGCVYLEPRSVLAIQGPAREIYTHAIRGRVADMVRGKLIPRMGDRISIVWRSHGDMPISIGERND